MYIDKNDNILSGSISYFQPESHQKHSILSKNNFTNLINNKGVSIAGKYKILDITGKWISQIESKNGHLYSTSLIQKKKTPVAANFNKTTCLAWFLITTYHYPDGSTETTEEYLGMTCSDCESGSYVNTCDETPSGGGGGSDVSSEEVLDFDSEIISQSSGPTPDPSSGFNISDFNLLPYKFSAIVRCKYTKTLHEIISVVGLQPTVIPMSQPFTDSNGDPAAVFYSIPTFNFTWTLLAPGIVYASFTFDCVHKYVFLSGQRTFTFPEGLSKVISTW